MENQVKNLQEQITFLTDLFDEHQLEQFICFLDKQENNEQE